MDIIVKNGQHVFVNDKLIFINPFGKINERGGRNGHCIQVAAIDRGMLYCSVGILHEGGVFKIHKHAGALGWHYSGVYGGMGLVTDMLPATINRTLEGHSYTDERMLFLGTDEDCKRNIWMSDHLARCPANLGDVPLPSSLGWGNGMDMLFHVNSEKIFVCHVQRGYRDPTNFKIAGRLSLKEDPTSIANGLKVEKFDVTDMLIQSGINLKETLQQLQCCDWFPRYFCGV